jgi:hypothetical protein
MSCETAQFASSGTIVIQVRGDRLARATLHPTELSGPPRLLTWHAPAADLTAGEAWTGSHEVLRGPYFAWAVTITATLTWASPGSSFTAKLSVPENPRSGV